MKKTKIICTLGPSTDNEEVLTQMIEAGMNVARFNFSHGTYEEHERRFREICALREKLSVPIATLLDTRGPEIRIGDFENTEGVVVSRGDRYTLTTEPCMGGKDRCYINYEGLPADIFPGATILINDGLISMKAERVVGNDIICTVVDGGRLTARKGVHVPGVSLHLPYLSQNDMNDLQFGKKMDFDFIAASFCRSETDITIIRDFLDAIGWKNVKIIAKIENAQGVENIDGIIRAADGIMVARGDMGVEVPFEKIPAIQKMIIEKSYMAGKIVVTATQMLESMIENPRPTRAEITDVANAIYDGTSAIMLSGESAVGKHPVEAVRIMTRIAETTESNIDYSSWILNQSKQDGADITEAISDATVTTANDLNAAAIVAVTKSGKTARMISKFRPSIPIIGATTSKKAERQLVLSWGVIPVLCEEKKNTDDLFSHAVEISKNIGLLKEGDIAVITAGIPLGVSGTTNMLKVQIVS
ncbi:MAG: pyruvate kinase [Clostridia bacterium]|nr:pyruvate kinase [Clostridia bacterium]